MYFNALQYFAPISILSKKRQKNSGFLTFSGGVEIAVEY